MTSLEQHLTDHAQSTRYVDGVPLCACKCGEWIASIVERGPVKAHRAHVADAWREARTVRTDDELDALPGLAIVKPFAPLSEAVLASDLADDRLDNPDDDDLPALILWTPKDGAL